MPSDVPTRLTRVTCTLPNDAVLALRKLAAENDRPVSRELTRALREYLANVGRTPESGTAA